MRAVTAVSKDITFQCERVAYSQPVASAPSVSSTSSRISDIDIAGNSRKNKNNKQKNNPSDPSKVAQSKNVGEYIPHDDGRKSRCKLVTTITKRSSHIPNRMTNDTPNNSRT